MWHLTQVLDIVGAQKVSKKGRRKILCLSILMISPDFAFLFLQSTYLMRNEAIPYRYYLMKD